MKKVIIAGVVVMAGILVFFFIFSRSQNITNYPNDGKTIVAFGDSLVEGVGATPGNNFPALLSKKIRKPILNMGVPGDTSTDGLNRIDQVIRQDPKIVLVLLGGNDFLRKVPIAETFKNIDDIVVELQKSGAVVVLLGIKGGLFGDHYKDYFEEIAEKRGALYVPNVLSGLLGKNEFMSDAIHPNDAGYKKIADKIYPVLQKVLE